MKILLAASFLLAISVLGGCASSGSTQSASPKPNIIFILADDLGIGDIEPFGQELIRTPHLTAMAQQGMRLNRFYAGTSVCAPSRASFMTGLHTGHTAIRGNKGMEPEGQFPLPDSAITIPEVLKQQGYVSGCFGKWGMGYVESSGGPTYQGFDHFFGYNCQSLAHNFYPDHLWNNTERIDYPNTPENQEVYSADLIHEKAMDFIDTQRDPFFLFLAYTLPHAALQVPEDSTFEYYKKLFNEQPQPIPEKWNGKGYQPNAYPKAAYAAMVSRLDRFVGEILAKLKEKGMDENTLVIFTSDNGPHKEGGNKPEFFTSSGPHRGTKRDLYEGGIRMPSIAWWPGKIQSGSHSDFPSAFWDMLPTFSELAGVKKVPTNDGVSIVPSLMGKEEKQKAHDYLYWEFHEQGGKQAVLKGNWKAIRLQASSPNPFIELYDMEKDPGEKNNLAEKNPEMVAEMAAIMDRAHIENPDFPLYSNN